MSTAFLLASASHPLAALGRLGQAPAGLAVEAIVGLALGTVTEKFLRAASLRWSWACVALVAAILLRRQLGGAAGVLVCASITATWRARRRHVADVETGADLAEAAARRWGPFDVIRWALNAGALRRRIRRPAPSRWFRGDELILGRDAHRALVSIPLGGTGGGTHTMLVGATGSGKTVTQTWIAVRTVERGMGAVVVDPKGDRSLRAGLIRAAETAGRQFLEWTPVGASVYNPFSRGCDTEIADKLLAGERFTEPHYLRQAQRFIGHTVRVLRRSGREVSLRTIVDHLEVPTLELLARDLPEEDARLTHEYLDSLTPRQGRDLAGVRDRLAVLVESDVGPWLDPGNTQGPHFDLLEAVQRRAVVYFDLDADSRPLLTQMLGAAIVQDLQTTVAALQGRPAPTVVVLDEFSALAAEQVVRLFGRARSAGFCLVLSTQELADLRLPGRHALLERVMGNLSVLLAHRQVVPASAELISSLAGMTGGWRTSRLGDGRVTRTRTLERNLSPAVVTSLDTGAVAAIVLGKQSNPRVAHVFSVRHGEVSS